MVAEDGLTSRTDFWMLDQSEADLTGDVGPSELVSDITTFDTRCVFITSIIAIILKQPLIAHVVLGDMWHAHWAWALKSVCAFCSGGQACCAVLRARGEPTRSASTLRTATTPLLRMKSMVSRYACVIMIWC
jgi:hypothetical protein